MISAVLFDLGGTLHVQDYPPESRMDFVARLDAFLRDSGIVLDVSPDALSEALKSGAAAYKRYSEETTRELPAYTIWADWYLKAFDFDRTKLYGISERLCCMYDGERGVYTPRPHLAETLRALSLRGLKLGVVSNIISRGYVSRVLEQYGVRRYLPYILTSAACGVRKPNREIFDIALDDLAVIPAECAYVGDTISRDVIGAQNAGLGAMIQIKNPRIAHKDLNFQGDGFDPDYLIDDLSQIISIIDCCNEEEPSD